MPGSSLDFPDLVADFCSSQGYSVEIDQEDVLVAIDLGERTIDVRVYRFCDRKGREFIGFCAVLHHCRKRYSDDLYYFLDLLSTTFACGRFNIGKSVRNNRVSCIVYRYEQFLAGVTDYEELLRVALEHVQEEIVEYLPYLGLILRGGKTYEDAVTALETFQGSCGNA